MGFIKKCVCASDDLDSLSEFESLIFLIPTTKRLKVGISSQIKNESGQSPVRIVPEKIMSFDQTFLLCLPWIVVAFINHYAHR
jgi:hypothetical protein